MYDCNNKKLTNVIFLNIQHVIIFSHCLLPLDNTDIVKIFFTFDLVIVVDKGSIISLIKNRITFSYIKVHQSYPILIYLSFTCDTILSAY